MREPTSKSYSKACEWLRAKPAVRTALTRSQLSDYRRIAALGDARGKRLDELGASYGLTRWIAGPVFKDAALCEQRYRAALRALAEGPVRHSQLRALQASSTKLAPTRATRLVRLALEGVA
jgi:hypothetical protein